MNKILIRLLVRWFCVLIITLSCNYIVVSQILSPLDTLINPQTHIETDFTEIDFKNTFVDFTNKNISIYDRAYSLWYNEPQKGLLKNTGFFVGGSVGIMCLLYLLPESATKWDKKSFTFENVFGKWLDNVRAGPVMDDDTWFMNYVAHPYWGGVFYMSARSLGYNALYSFLYNAAMSTFLWEYGIEAFAEIPSIQDLIVTPVIGTIMGELFYLAKREIVRNNYRVLNSKFLGHCITFVFDPANEFFNLISKDKSKNDVLTLSFSPISNTTKFSKTGYYINFSYSF